MEQAGRDPRSGPAGAAGGRRLGDVGEDGVLGAILPLFEARSTDLVGPGDDAAVVATGSGSVVVTTDTVVRDRDWRDEWSSAEDVGAKVVTQNLADLAAMGAAPLSVLVTLVADAATPLEWAVGLARAIADAAAAAGASVVGGDLSSAPPGCLMVSVTALGDLEGRAPVLRSGARAGDVVAVAGSLGMSEAGLRILAGAEVAAGATQHVAELVQQHRRPRSPLQAGPQAARAGATSMIDISDGLSRDAGRLARASGVRLDLDAGALGPDQDRVRRVLGDRSARECVLGGGEEHSLLATFPRGRVPSGWRVIGRVLPAGEGPGVTIDGEVDLPAGWDHFGG